MMTTATPGATGPPPTRGASPETIDLTRRHVREMLSSSAAFRALPPDQQLEIARNTVNVTSYLAEPEGMRVVAPAVGAAATQGADPYAFPLADPLAPTTGASRSTSSSRSANAGPGGTFVAQGAREGAAVAGALLAAVNFPNFVAGLVQGVFHAIVTSTIEQMEAYGKLVADVAKTLNQFRDENVTANQGRDHLVEQHPDLFMLDLDTGANGAAPRVRYRDGIDDREALDRINSLPIEGGPLRSLDEEAIEEKLVPAARTQLATSRQQLLATMVLMGINRIVVTDGRISAKVLYDFQARDNYKRQLGATQFDYGDQYAYTSEGEQETDYQGGERRRSRGEKGEWDDEQRDASYYSKGTYKNSAQPVLKLASALNETTDAALTTKASLAGTVDINFKSDYFPLEKMADSFQIAQIQTAAKPGSGNGGVAKGGAGGQQSAPAPTAGATPRQ